MLLVLHRQGEGAIENKASWKWLKTGIEFYEGKPYISTVCTDRWSDWSIVPLPEGHGSGKPSATIEVERDGGTEGKTLWVYQIWDNGTEVRESLDSSLSV